MSRITAAFALAALLMTVLALPASASGYSYADDFGSGDYRGSTGSESWSVPWTELGESDGPDSGSVTISDSDLCTLNPCLVVEALVDVTNLGAARRIAVEPGDSAELRYDIDFPGGAPVQGSALVQASPDGANWQTISTYAPGTRGTFRVSLPRASSTIDIRFVASRLSPLSSMGVDSVVVTVSPGTTTSSSTTTVTNPTTTVTSPTTTVTHPTTTVTHPTTTVTHPTTTVIMSQTRLHSTSTTSTTSTTVRKDSAPGGPASAPPSDPPRPPPPSQTDGAVTRFDPGLGRSASDLTLQAQHDLGLRLVRAGEHLGFDIVANLLLGVFLAWASVTRLDRRRTPA